MSMKLMETWKNVLNKQWPFGIGLRASPSRNSISNGSYNEVNDLEVGIQRMSNGNNKGVFMYIESMDMRFWDPYLIRPVIQLHVVDRSTGEYLHSCMTDRTINDNFKDNNNENNAISCVRTEPVAYDGSGCIRWNQTLYLPISFEDFSKVREYCVILVEVLGSQSLKQGEGESTMVCWGFMKWATEELDRNRKYMLKYEVQLYEAQKLSIFQRLQAKSRGFDLEQDNFKIYVQYLCQRRIYYLSVLNVAITEGNHGQRLSCDTVTMHTSESVDESQSYNGSSLDKKTVEFSALSRNKFEPCIFPNVPALALEVGEVGDIILQFSNGGDTIAISSNSGEQVYSIKIYRTNDGIMMSSKEAAHHAKVRDLRWSKSDQLIVTTSDDCSVKIWEANMLELLNEIRKEIPLYEPVLCVLFESIENGMSSNIPRIFTGSKDGNIRLWNFPSNDTPKSETFIYKNHVYHNGPISAMLLDERISRLYVGDEVGCITIWGSTQINEVLSYTLLRRLDKFIDFHGKAITSLSLCYARQRGELLISASPGTTVRSFNLSSQELEILPSNISTIAKQQAMTGRTIESMESIFSPDGRFLMIGNGEELKCWDIEACQEMKLDICGGYRIHSFDWCKTAHIIAVSDKTLGVVVIFHPELDDE